MKIAVFGTKMVGQAIATKLVELGHEVMMGSRSATNESALEWKRAVGDNASVGTFADAAAFGEIVFNCTSGAGSLAALEAAVASNLDGKVLVDIANPLDFSNGFPPSLFVSNTDSLGEQIQRALPSVRVVKTLNIVNCNVMVDPSLVANGEHDMFLCGNDPDAKAQVRQILTEWFGWKHVIDLGDITSARATESYLHLWLRLMGALGGPNFALKVVQ
jgi:8-hydroxy-5-deazaflavin:NADPH oxidoreductase